MNVTTQARPADPEPESADLFDYGLLRDYAGFVLGSSRRHKLLIALTFVATVAGAVGILAGLPKTYHVDTKVLAQRNQVIAALGNPGRAVPFEADAPTRAAAETILRRDNLISLARQTNLVMEWQRTRAPFLRIKDWAMARLGRPRTDEERLNEIVGLLDKRLKVTTGEGTVTIEVEWPDARSAYRLAETAQRNFFEARHISESNAIAEAVSLLEGHATLLRERVDETAEELRKAMEARTPRKARLPPPVAAAPAEDPEVARLEVLVESKRREIKDLDDFRTRELAELHARIAEQGAIYSKAHPVMIDLQEKLDALEKQESPQIAGLQQDEAELSAALAKHGGRRTPRNGAPPRARPMAGEIQQLSREVNGDGDPTLENLRGELRFALGKYATVLDRIDNATMELEAARAAFKYRYSVLVPAEMPRAPKKPKAALVMAAAVVLGFVLALLLAVVVDLRRGLIVERWQVGRALDLPILADLGVEAG